MTISNINNSNEIHNFNFYMRAVPKPTHTDQCCKKLNEQLQNRTKQKQEESYKKDNFTLDEAL